jgi:PTS system nitrogen regulatory IIA component
MKSVLNALQEGRLIELPDDDKNSALEYLAALIEAVPDIGVEGGITENVMAREQAHNTGIGKGWACPHARTPRDGEVVCSVGWSPTGIDYGSADNQPVHILVMYFIPETQKNAYLKEISFLAKAIQTQTALQDLKSLGDLGEVRHRLLDAMSVALEAAAPDARARMIQLEVKHAEAQGSVVGLGSGVGMPTELAGAIVPLSILGIPGSKPVVLCQDPELVTALEAAEQLISNLLQNGRAEHGGIQVLLRSSSNYQPDRVVFDCLAVRVNKAVS